MTEGIAGKRRWLTGVAVVAALGTGVLAARNSLGLSLARTNPALASRIDPSNGAALGGAALARLQSDTSKQGRAETVRIARAALRRDPTAASALSVIGLLAPTRVEAVRAIRQSEALTRRSLPTQLWLIEDSVARGDITGALHHYDVALRTSRVAPSFLFPVLVGAVSDPGILPALADTLARRPAWGGLFLQHLAQSGQDLPPIVRLFSLLQRRGVETGVAATGTVYARLLERNRFDLAWTLYQSRHPRASRAGLRNGLFTDVPANPTPFDWQLSDTTAVTARIETDATGGQLVFSGASGEGGEAARQLLLLAPGRHRVRAVVSDLQAPDDARPYLRLSCATGGAELSRQLLPDADTRGRAAALDVTVPADCPAQWLSVVVQAPTSLGSVEGRLARVAVDRP